MTELVAEKRERVAAALRDQQRHLKRRYAAERRFRAYGLTAIVLAVTFLAVLLFSIVSKGYSAFWLHEVALDITFSADVIDPEGTRDPAALSKANYAQLVRESLFERFPEVTDRGDRRALINIDSSGADLTLRLIVLDEPEVIGRTRTVWVKTSDDVDTFLKGLLSRDLPESERRVKDREIEWIDALEADGRIRSAFDTTFFTSGDSREPEQAGIWGAV